MQDRIAEGKGHILMNMTASRILLWRRM